MGQKDYTSVQQISIKTPNFMETAINGWFSIVEAQFYVRGIRAKFYTIIASILVETVMKIPASVLDSQNYDDLRNNTCGIPQSY